MMRLRVFKIFLLMSLLSFYSHASNKIYGFIYEQGSNLPLSNVSIYDDNYGLLAISNPEGYYEFYSDQSTFNLIFSLEKDL